MVHGVRTPAGMMERPPPAEVAKADRLTMAGGTAGIELMENAGRAVADNVASRHPPGTSIAVVAGPGNNGGGGFVCARGLRGRAKRPPGVPLWGLSRVKREGLAA